MRQEKKNKWLYYQNTQSETSTIRERGAAVYYRKAGLTLEMVTVCTLVSY